MKIKNSQALEALAALDSLAFTSLRAKACYALAKNQRKLKVLVDDVRGVHTKLLEKYQVDGKPPAEGSDNYKALAKEYLDLMEVENEFEPHELAFAELENEKLSIAAVNALDFIIQEPK